MENPSSTIILFHGIASGNNDEWKETWMSRPIYVQEKWLPEDMENNTHILSLSYDSNLVASVQKKVMELGKNLIQTLVIRFGILL
jgi:hypothetical protein